MIQVVLFDIGGVLSTEPIPQWRHRWESRLGLPPGEIDRLFEPLWLAGSIGEISEPVFEAAVAGLLGLGPDALREILRDMWLEYLGEPNEALITYFAQLRRRFRTGILSNSFVGAREKERSRYGFEDLCDVVVYSHEIGVNKPDPSAYHIACQQLHVEPCHVIFVDDREENILAARTLGMEALLFEHNDTLLPMLDERLGL